MNTSEDYQTKLFPYTYNILGSIDDANDLTEDAIIDLLKATGMI